MDINLKNNKKTINKVILVISLCIAILPILFGLSKGFFQLDRFSYEDYILNAVKGLPYKDGNDTIREDVIVEEIVHIKEGNQFRFEGARKEFEEFSKELGINPNEELKETKNKITSRDDYSIYVQLKNDYDSAKNDFNKSEDEYRNNAVNRIKEKLDEKEIQDNQRNIEYYVENQYGQIISNINEQSKNNIIEQTKSNSKDYIIVLDITKESPKEVNITSSMKWAYNDFFKANKVNYQLAEFKNVIIRISNPLQTGDELYTKAKKNTLYDTIGYVSLLLFVLDLCIISILALRFVKEKEFKFKENIVLRLYNKSFIELRVLSIILTFTLLLGLNNIITFWGVSLIQNYIPYTVMYNVNWSPVYNFCMQLFSLFIVTIAIEYLAICDIYNLYLVKKTGLLKEYIYDKSLFRIICTRFFNKSMAGRMTLALSIILLYLTSIISTAKTPSYYYCWLPLVIINIIFTIFILIYILFFFINLHKIKIGTEHIISGTYKNEIKIKGSFFLKELATNIMNIEDGLGIAIDNAIKSERMKGELITNVSHDLKTPLTSIINYVDLLDKENISEENRKKYLGVLKERSARLKVLIEDLFEASKAASGNFEMHMEYLDPVALLRQTLGEFEDKISTSNLDFVKTIPEKKLTIYADGKKTFRVFQNLISNILKYSLKGTRVYIDVEEKDDFVSITFKNISEYSLNFTEEEILERFKRGDSSRTTEGSGLGLSIAKNLIELQGGIFEIKLDGDLFKVVVLLKKQKL